MGNGVDCQLTWVGPAVNMCCVPYRMDNIENVYSVIYSVARVISSEVKQPIHVVAQ